MLKLTGRPRRITTRLSRGRIYATCLSLDGRQKSSEKRQETNPGQGTLAYDFKSHNANQMREGMF